MRIRALTVAGVATVVFSAVAPAPADETVTAAAGGWQFTEVTAAAGIDAAHGFLEFPTIPQLMGGGAAAADYNADGHPDLYLVQGQAGPNLLYRNRGDGTFEEVAAAAGAAIDDDDGVGPAFADLDGDGWLDLVIGGVRGTLPRYLRSLGRGPDGRVTFTDATADWGVFATRDTFSTAFADIDRDGDLDLFNTHWSSLGGGSPHLWLNNGASFEPRDFSAGIASVYSDVDRSFTPNFADIDNDGWLDLLVAGDFGTSQVFRNLGTDEDGRLRFAVATDPAVITDENGMGAAVGDIDNDGDLDWFVSSIWDDGEGGISWGTTGNRLYRNVGGSFVDATDEAGVRVGHWGWGACLADFDNDGWLDLFHTNGFSVDPAEDFWFDPARMFVNDGDGTFVERSAELGVDHTGQGRGVVCFDYDGDGDIDLFVHNSEEPPLLYRNDLSAGNHYLQLRLRGGGLNSEAIGARVTVVAGGLAQIREVRSGNNYLSQNPTTLHFGLGPAARVDELRIVWPDGEIQVREDVDADQRLVIVKGASVEVPALSTSGFLLLVLALAAAAVVALRRLVVEIR